MLWLEANDWPFDDKYTGGGGGISKKSFSYDNKDIENGNKVYFQVPPL